MERLRIAGRHKLQGAVTISGAKNAALPQIAAAPLSSHPLELANLPVVTDVANMLRIIELHGAEITHSPHATTIDARHIRSGEVSYDTVRHMRASVLVLRPLLARFGEARVSLPGGCAVGARPVDS
jgi:UDP-N-acetylglucosamine 1-carboxyvinyltransferase